MAYKIYYKKAVVKDLKSFDRKDQDRILYKIETELSTNPSRYPTIKDRFAGLRKLRVGKHRVIYSIIERDVWVLRIGHRNKIYKRGSRRV